MSTEVTVNEQQTNAVDVATREFELKQRQAKMLSNSTLIPKEYQASNPNGLSNCYIALDMAQRMNANPLIVMQNLYIVHGKPAWSSQWIIASINNCGKFSPLRFEITELGEINAGTSKIKNKQCIARAYEKATGERLESAPVTIQMAIDEGWYGKNGSKWKTMPDVMLRYRAASFFGKFYCPELLMGIQSLEETQDIIDVNPGKPVVKLLNDAFIENEEQDVNAKLIKDIHALMLMKNLSDKYKDYKFNDLSAKDLIEIKKEIAVA